MVLIRLKKRLIHFNKVVFNEVLIGFSRRALGRNPNPLRGFCQDLLNVRGPPQNPPWAGFEGDRSH